MSYRGVRLDSEFPVGGSVTEAQRILAAVEQDGHLKGYATLSELTSWDCWSWPIEGASNDGRVGTFLAEALKGFVEAK